MRRCLLVHKIKRRKSKEIEWGFDLTEVSSEKELLDLLKKYGFKKVESQKPEEYIMTEIGKISARWKDFYGNRFREHNVLFVNPQGIKIRLEHFGGRGEDKGYVGHIGIKAPRKSLAVLKRFLREFRGSKPIKELDWQGRKGVVRYVKEETPYESGFIWV